MLNRFQDAESPVAVFIHLVNEQAPCTPFVLIQCIPDVFFRANPDLIPGMDRGIFLDQWFCVSIPSSEIARHPVLHEYRVPLQAAEIPHAILPEMIDG